MQSAAGRKKNEPKEKVRMAGREVLGNKHKTTLKTQDAGAGSALRRRAREYAGSATFIQKHLCKKLCTLSSETIYISAQVCIIAVSVL